MNASAKNKTGLFFGSFDPIHLGHLIIAEFILCNTHIAEIWFVVSPQNPLKTDQSLTHHTLRKEMLELAIEGREGFNVCDIEFQMPFPHYTHKTLEALSQKYPQKDFSLIIGSDNLEVFDKWKNYMEIMERIEILVYPRPGHESTKFTEHLHIKPVKAPLLEISSTYIRDSFAGGRPARFMLPGKVFDFISTRRLYQHSGEEKSFKH